MWFPLSSIYLNEFTIRVIEDFNHKKIPQVSLRDFFVCQNFISARSEITLQYHTLL